MTRFDHQPRSGRKRAPKKRKRLPLGLRDLDSLILHREMEFLRHPTRGRAYKLDQAERGRRA